MVLGNVAGDRAIFAGEADQSRSEVLGAVGNPVRRNAGANTAKRQRGTDDRSAVGQRFCDLHADTPADFIGSGDDADVAVECAHVGHEAKPVDPEVRQTPGGVPVEAGASDVDG